MSAPDHEPVFAQLEAANAAYVADGAHRELPVRPARRLSVVTCMDARIDVYAALGLDLGDVHVIRTAGARVTDDVLRSLALSTHVLGTNQVAVIAHTDCGLHDPEGRLPDQLAEKLGPGARDREWHTFTDPEDAVRSDCERLRVWEDRPADLRVAGYVLDITDGRLHCAVPPLTDANPT